ncbi:MAG TPA: O-antigen ligase family protein [Opitutus sp.]|nr:O-antigen ligase family protein [Opitutus sp.]
MTLAAHKLPRGTNPWPPSPPGPPSLLERLTLVHVGVLVVFAAWAFGGNTTWAQIALAWWGSLGALITLLAVQDRAARERGYLRPLRWLWPLGAFNVIVLASTLNVSFRAVASGADWLYVEGHSLAGLPSTARPLLTLAALWFFDAAYLSCFNLALVIRTRRALRALLLVVAANAFALAIFGTIQKLMGAKGLYFGLKSTRQLHFFASFIYDNHWGAFAVLMCGITIGLVAHYARHHSARDLLHSPAPVGLIVTGFLAAAIVLSSSRSGTALVIVLLGVSFLHWIVSLVRTRRRDGRPVLLPVAGALLALAIAAWFAGELARPEIARRLADTRGQVAEMRASGSFGVRTALYRDTWNMAREKLAFGWGMGSYPTVFYRRNTQQFSHLDGLPMYFHDAHSDWLQSLSEVGLVGTLLLGLCAGVPLFHRWRTLGRSPLTGYLLAACGLIVLYAWVEFPFGNRAVVIAWWLCFFCAVHYGRLDGAADQPA